MAEMTTETRELRTPDTYNPDNGKLVVENLDKITKYALNLMEDAWQHAKAANEEQHRTFEKVRKLYIGAVQRKRNYKGAADLWPNVVFEAIDSQIPILFRSLFPDTDFFEIEAQGDSQLQDDTTLKRLAKLHVALVSAAIQDMQFFDKAIQSLRYCAKYGTMILMPFWNLQKAKLRSRQDIEEPQLDESGQPLFDLVPDPITGGVVAKPITQTRTIPIYVDAVVSDTADALVIDPSDFFPCDPNVPDLNLMDYVERRFDTTLNKLRQQEATEDGYGYYRNLDLLDKVMSSEKDWDREPTQNTPGTRTEKLGRDVTCVETWFAPGIFNPLDVPDTDDSDVAEFCAFWGVEPTELEGGWVMTLADQTVPIRIQPNPYKMQTFPFVATPFFRIDKQFWGMGIPELIESYQFEIADKRNQAMDAVTRAIKSRWIFAADALEDRKDPLKRFLAGDEDYLAVDPSNAPNGLAGVVHEVVSRINPQYPFQAAQEAKIDMQSMTGTSNNMAGAESFNRATATEVNIREQSGMSRIELRVVELEFGWVIPFLQWIYRLNDQFYDRQKAVKVAGENGIAWESLTDADFALDLKFTPKGSKVLANKLAAMNQIVQLSASPVFAQFLNVPELLEDIFRLLLRLPDPKRYIVNPMEPKLPVPIELQEQLFMEGHGSDVDPMQPLQEGVAELQQHMLIHQQRGMMGAAPLEMATRERHMQMHQMYIQQQIMAAQQQMMMAQQEQGGSPEKPNQPDKETGQGAPSPGGMGREMVPNAMG